MFHQKHLPYGSGHLSSIVGFSIWLIYPIGWRTELSIWGCAQLVAGFEAPWPGARQATGLRQWVGFSESRQCSKPGHRELGSLICIWYLRNILYCSLPVSSAICTESHCPIHAPNCLIGCWIMVHPLMSPEYQIQLWMYYFYSTYPKLFLSLFLTTHVFVICISLSYLS